MPKPRTRPQPLFRKGCKEILECGLATGWLNPEPEMPMKCGIGQCGRENSGGKPVPRLGPSFTREALKALPAQSEPQA